jgi:uncharacterized protein (TIGR02271 family)
MHHRKETNDMSDQTWNIVGGSEVIGSDGEKLGTVDRVEGQYIVARKGWFFPSDHYIPESAIASVTDNVVTLNVPKDTILDQGWDSAPGGTVTDTGYVEGNALSTPDGTAGYVASDAVDTSTEQDFEQQSTTERVRSDDEGTIRVPLAEEELTATRRGVERGAVHVDKEVVAEEQTLDVPVTEERVTVNRRVVDRDVQPGDTVFEDTTIDVPVYGEEVDLQKQARVREELEISKEAVESTERVSGTVRREEAHVTDTTESVDRDAVDTDANRR